MKVKDFYELVELTREPEATLLPNLQYRTKKYPFFQPDIFIYIKCLYLSSSEDFADELTRLAPFVSDRKALFYYVMDDQYRQFRKRVEKRLSANRTDMLINAFFETLNEPEPDVLLEDSIANQSIASSDYFSYLESVTGERFDSSFAPETNFIDINDFVPIEDMLETEIGVEPESLNLIEDNSELLEEEDDMPLMKHQDIIDRFIEKAATEDVLRIKLDRTEETLSEDELDNMEAESSQSDLENDYFFTQTLANIYIKQKKYKRAYEIIKHLSLNYPEKNIYFADQLSFLGKLIKNSNINK